jgi:hypothetical protein
MEFRKLIRGKHKFQQVTLGDPNEFLSLVRQLAALDWDKNTDWIDLVRGETD